jgi:glycine/D-amino acid oxidase-like deaminating enzyme
VDARYNQESLDYKRHGVHVLLAQNQYGEFIIGDSHHYGKTLEPFDHENINEIIIDYLNSFVDLGTLTITERWNGVYPKVEGNTCMIIEAAPGVTIVNGLGGAGMTLSFGVAEENINAL